MAAPIRVLIVDDSAIVRQVASEAIASQSDMRVLNTASDPLFAIEKMRKEWPDVIVLDIEMPRMDGLTFLRKIMAERPTPVVICSTLTEKGSETALQALSAGAVGMNLLHAAHAHGFVGSWLTGWAAYSPNVAKAFGVADGDTIVGYFFFGTAATDLSERPRPEYDDVVSSWDI